MRRALSFSLLLPAALLIGCGDKEMDDGNEDGDDIYDHTPSEGEGEDTATVCDGTWSVVEGVVTGPYSDDPAVGAQVYVWGDAFEDSFTTETDDEGAYSITVPPVDEAWVEAYTYDGCWSYSTEFAAEECVVQTIDIHIEDCDVADKPNLYLYPETDTQMRVRLELDWRQSVVASIPPYREGGWHGTAHPDGTWTENGRLQRDPFLFYEVSLAGWQAQELQRDAGWCIPFGGLAAVHAMADILADYGFDARERDDFVDAWVHDLPPADSYAVFPQVEVDAYAGLDIEPVMAVDRLWLVVDDGAGCAPRVEPEVLPFDRSGEHGVEWGVVLGDLVR